MSWNFEGTMDESENDAAFSRLIGMFYILVGVAGMIVLLFSSRPAGFQIFSEPLTIIAMTALFLVLIIIGLIMAVLKRHPKKTFVS